MQIFDVRTGLGTINSYTGEFTDVIEKVQRVVRQHHGWQSVTYKGKRYQLLGGVRTNCFICLNSPIKGRKG